jgi:heptosyltransferase-2
MHSANLFQEPLGGSTGGMKDRVLICGVNWLGDALMSLPAVRAMKRASPGCELMVLAKSFLLPLWESEPSVSGVLELEHGPAGTCRTVARIRGARCRVAYVFPNSFRSALLPFLGMVPERVGSPGHQRVWMLTRVASVGPDAQRGHQSREYFDILGIRPEVGDLAGCRLAVPAAAVEAADAMLGRSAAGESLVALIPGAARGPSKCWPEANFIETGRTIAAGGVRIAVFGSSREVDLCARVSKGIGPSCMNLAGRTSLLQMAACLQRCRVAVTNDSGGMHMAAAAGTRVVAIYGLTDPSKTGPMGEGHAVMVASGVQGSRDIARRSRAAVEALASIAPGQVVAAVRERL